MAGCVMALRTSDALVSTLTGEDTTRKARAIKGPVRPNQVRPEARGNLGEGTLPRLHYLARDGVGVRDDGAQRSEGGSHGGLTGANPTADRDHAGGPRCASRTQGAQERGGASPARK